MELIRCREGFDELARRLSEAEWKLAEAGDAARTLAILALQSDRYHDDPDFRNAVDEALAIAAQNRDD